MDLSMAMSLLALCIACMAFFNAKRNSQNREFNSCDMTLIVTDVATKESRTFTLGASSNSCGTRTAWISKFTKDAIVNMLTLYPEAEVHRLVVEVQSSRFYNSAK